MMSKHGLFRLSFERGRSRKVLRYTSQAECLRTLRKLQRRGPAIIANVEIRTVDGWINSGTEF